ncbi:MAG: hypothetical protein J6A28_04635 [Clostridia bacterium]|nr:hypothetical protein [Clostridia bacterium]
MNNIKIKNHRLLYAAIGFGFAICIMLGLDETTSKYGYLTREENAA